MEASAVGVKDVLLGMLLATLVSCTTGDAVRDEATMSEKPKPRSVEWLRQHCPDCVNGGPRYAGPGGADPRNAAPGNAGP